METNRTCVLKLGLTLLAIGGSFWFYIRFRRSLFLKSVKVGYVSKIICYPVTSCTGINENSAYCTKLGLDMMNFKDREYIVGQTDSFNMTVQYLSPKLKDIEVFIDGCNLLLKYRDQPEIKIVTGTRKKKQAHTLESIGMEIDVLDCGNKVGVWFNDRMQETNLKLYDCKYTWAIESKRFKTVACVLAMESSMKEISEIFRIEEDISVEFFRPNIIISGTEPLDEKNWDMIYIGDEAALEKRAFNFKLIENAFDIKALEWRHESDPHDPLDGAVCIPCSVPSLEFGVYATVFREGKIRVNDPVFVVYKPTYLSVY